MQFETTKKETPEQKGVASFINYLTKNNLLTPEESAEDISRAMREAMAEATISGAAPKVPTSFRPEIASLAQHFFDQFKQEIAGSHIEHERNITSYAFLGKIEEARTLEDLLALVHTLDDAPFKKNKLKDPFKYFKKIKEILSGERAFLDDLPGDDPIKRKIIDLSTSYGTYNPAEDVIEPRKEMVA